MRTELLHCAVLKLEIFLHVLLLFIHLLEVVLVSFFTFLFLLGLWNNVSISSALHELFI